MNTTPSTPLSFPGKKHSGDSVVNGVDLSVNFAGIKAPTPSGWPPLPPPTKPITWYAPMKRAGAAWYGKPWVKSHLR